MEPTTSEVAAIIARAEAHGRPVPAVDFMGAFLKGPAEAPPSQLGRMVEFAATQRAKWLTRYRFSPANRPDEAAAAEVHSWDSVWTSLAESLFAAVPEVRTAMVDVKTFAPMSEALATNLALTEGRPIARATNAIRSQLGITASRIGLKQIAHRLYCSALYPPGTVGRVTRA